MPRYLLTALLLVFGALPVHAADQWLVVAAPAFRSALQPLWDHRKAEGFQVVTLQTTDILSEKEILAADARKLRDKVNKLCRDHKDSTYVLLVGAVEPNGLADPETKVLPPLKGTVSRMKNQPTDHGYGNPGDDFLPTTVVGRFPADSEEEVKQMVQKTLAFERDRQPGEWRRRLTVLGGAPEFGPVVDALAEKIALAHLDQIDPAWSGQAIFHMKASHFCLPDKALHERALEYVQGGQLLTLYFGHSNAQGFWAGEARYLDRADWQKLAIPRGAGILATFGCHGCQLAGMDGEGYGVAAMRNPRGPVAVIGSHGICFAAMVHLAGDGLFDGLLKGKPPERLGACWRKVQEGVAKGSINPFTFRLLDAVDGDGDIPEATQRREHLEMFMLLGDPALKMPVLPGNVKLSTSGVVRAGQHLTITGEVPGQLEGAKVRLTLERPLSSLPPDLQPLPPEEPERSKIMSANHEKANRFALLSREATVKNGRFEVQVPLPNALPWPRLTLRAYAATDTREGLGVLIVPAQP
jgi:hypothetical protein